MRRLTLILLLSFGFAISVVRAETEGEAVLRNLVRFQARVEQARAARRPTPFQIAPSDAGDLQKLVGLSRSLIQEELGGVCHDTCSWPFFWLPPDYLGGGPTLYAAFDTNDVCSEVYVVHSQ